MKQLLISILTAAMLCSLASAQDDPCSRVLGARNQRLVKEYRDWKDRVEVLETMSLDQLEAEFKKTGGGGGASGYGVSLGGGGGTEHTRREQLVAALTRHYQQSSSGRIVREEALDEVDHKALEAWQRCMEMMWSRQKVGFIATLVSQNGRTATLELGYYNDDPRAQSVRIVSVTPHNIASPRQLVGAVLGRLPTEIVVQKLSDDAGQLEIEIEFGNESEQRQRKVITLGTSSESSWRAQIQQCFIEGRSAVASQGCFSDRIEVCWKAVDGAIRYCVSVSDTPDFNPEQGPRFLWVRSDAEAVRSAFPDGMLGTRFVLSSSVKEGKKWPEPGKVYYFKVQYEIWDPRDDFPGKVEEHVRRDMLPGMPVAGTIAP